MKSIQRVASLHLQKIAMLKSDGEIYAKDGSWKLSWHSRGTLTLLEAPLRSPKQRAMISDPERGAKAVQWQWSPEQSTPQDRYSVLFNVFPRAGIKITDSAAEVRAKLEIAFKIFLNFLRKNVSELTSRYNTQEKLEAWLDGKDPHFPLDIRWWKEYVAPATFVPKSMKPIKVKGKNFEIVVSPDDFKILDFDPLEGGSSGYEAETPAAALKVYKWVVKNPDIVKQMTESQFIAALRAAKIPVKTRSSYYR
jgi:hypothetical protein